MPTIEELLDDATVHRLQPGDTLVIHLPDGRYPSLSEIATLRDRAEALLPDNKVVFVVGESIEIRRPTT